MYEFGIIDKQEIENYLEWINNHKCKFTYDPDKNPFPPTGAIGGGLTYSFTPTGLGVIIKVKCACGEEADVTDYDSW